MTIHVVQPGESVNSIASYYGIDPARLSSDNAVPANGALAVGQTLVIRFPRQIHAVRPGETLTSIASAYGTTVRQLWRNNWFLGGNEFLSPGQTLVISYFDEKLGPVVSNGYAYPYIEPSLLAQQLPYLSYLAPFTYGITASGDLLPLEDDTMLASARQRGTGPVMHLSTLTESGQFDTQRGELVLTDQAIQGRLIDQVLRTVLERVMQAWMWILNTSPASWPPPMRTFFPVCAACSTPRANFCGQLWPQKPVPHSAVFYTKATTTPPWPPPLTESFS